MLHVTLCADQVVWVGHSALLTGWLCGATFFQTLASRCVQATSEPAALVLRFQASPGVDQRSLLVLPGAHKLEPSPRMLVVQPRDVLYPQSDCIDSHEVL